MPPVGDYTDDVWLLYTPLVAALPHRVANDICARVTRGQLSSRGPQASLRVVQQIIAVVASRLRHRTTPL
jgi:hypothetical protein